jgi:hypothetical protein
MKFTSKRRSVSRLVVSIMLRRPCGCSGPLPSMPIPPVFAAAEEAGPAATANEGIAPSFAAISDVDYLKGVVGPLSSGSMRTCLPTLGTPFLSSTNSM